MGGFLGDKADVLPVCRYAALQLLYELRHMIVFERVYIAAQSAGHLFQTLDVGLVQLWVHAWLDGRSVDRQYIKAHLLRYLRNMAQPSADN